MHVGMAAVFQNTGRQVSDHQIYLNELALADMAEPLGFDSIWSVEHHFTDYTMCPDVVQFLSYMAGRTKHVKLGSMVVVLPWHDPVRAAEQIAMLDLYCGDRELTLGFGRGSGRIEQGSKAARPAFEYCGRGEAPRVDPPRQPSALEKVGGEFLR